MTQDEQVVECYAAHMLSEVQVAERLAISANRVRRILDKNNIKRRSISDAVRYLYITKFNKKPFVLKNSLSHQEQLLKAAGTMLYWGEGAKRGNSVAFSNSDPRMILVFLNFLRTICGIDEKRLRVTIHYYPDLNIKKLTKYWSRITRIPQQNFYKPFLHVRTKGTYRAKSLHGTICLQYSDSKLLEEINGWIEKYQLEFGSRI